MTTTNMKKDDLITLVLANTDEYKKTHLVEMKKDEVLAIATPFLPAGDTTEPEGVASEAEQAAPEAEATAHENLGNAPGKPHSRHGNRGSGR